MGIVHSGSFTFRISDLLPKNLGASHLSEIPGDVRLSDGRLRICDKPVMGGR